MTSESVRVAVRVRPFNDREKERGAKCVIEMDGTSTKIVNPSDPQNVKTFSFDYSYWSHDRFIEGSGGQLIQDSPQSPYASQQRVFEDLGQDVLHNALEGYNCSLFAYGQTGSGKSYSMVGYAKNKGIVPITCNELFNTIDSNTTSSTKFAVSLSMLEIYNERVRDLLTKSNKNLEVRQSEKLGFYVQDLEKINVGSYKEIEKKMNQGTANRTIAATQMNATSSRAHTVITIEFKQIISTDMGVNTKSSTINLIDLAGSERADSTGATGDRLKEGANINKSLSALGNVIAALADQSGGKKNVLVPYRDSVLTKMLKNALGGNSKTIMIAALSPADINYDETLSTLRYADRAKRIKNVAMVNENPLEKLIRELLEENERLKQMLNGELPKEIDTQNLSEKEIEKIRKELEAELRADMKFNSDLLELHDQSSWHGPGIESEKSNLSEGIFSNNKTKEYPYLCNLNEDPQLSGVLLYFIDNVELFIGKSHANDGNSIIICGPGIQSHHAIIAFNEVDNMVSINPCSTDSVVRVNGLKISSITIINDLDRILLGSNNLYIFHNPFLLNEDPISVDWEFAQMEMASADGYTSGERSVLESQVIEILPMVNEINAISKEMNSQRVFNVLIIPAVAQEVLYGEEANPKVVVKMTSTINNNSWLWERSVFINRRYIIQDHYQAFLNGEDHELISESENPFWEPPTDLLVGQAFVYLQNISYNLGMDHEVRVLDYKGKDEGILCVKVEPCNDVGHVAEEDNVDSIIDDPNDLLDKSLNIKISIKKVTLYKPRFIHGSTVTFRFYRQDKTYTTETVKDTLEAHFNFEVIIVLGSITKDHLQYFQDGWITFLVYGTQEDVSTTKPKDISLYKHKEASVKAEFNRCRDEMELKVSNTIDRKQSKKIKKIKKICIKWASKSPEEQQFDPFFREITSKIFSGDKKLNVVADTIGKTKKSKKNVEDSQAKSAVTRKDIQRTNITLSRKVGGKDVSEICSLM